MEFVLAVVGRAIEGLFREVAYLRDLARKQVNKSGFGPLNNSCIPSTGGSRAISQVVVTPTSEQRRWPVLQQLTLAGAPKHELPRWSATNSTLNLVIRYQASAYTFLILIQDGKLLSTRCTTNP